MTCVFFLKISAGRREDYAKISLETEVEAENMLRHSKIRWLSIGKSARRIVHQWPNIIKYFLEYLPTQKEEYKRISKTRRFKQIVETIKDPESKIYMIFPIYLCSLVEDFIKLFQSSKPVGHLIYPAIGDLFFKILTNFVPLKELCKDDNRRKTTYELGKLNMSKVSFLPLDEMGFGNELKTELNAMAKKGRDPSVLKTVFKKSYIAFF